MSMDLVAVQRLLAFGNARYTNMGIPGGIGGLPSMGQTNGTGIQLPGSPQIPNVLSSIPMTAVGAGGTLPMLNTHPGFYTGFPPQPSIPLGEEFRKYAFPGPLNFIHPHLSRLPDESFHAPIHMRDRPTLCQTTEFCPNQLSASQNNQSENSNTIDEIDSAKLETVASRKRKSDEETIESRKEDEDTVESKNGDQEMCCTNKDKRPSSPHAESGCHATKADGADMAGSLLEETSRNPDMAAKPEDGTNENSDPTSAVDPVVQSVADSVGVTAIDSTALPISHSNIEPVVNPLIAAVGNPVIGTPAPTSSELGLKTSNVEPKVKICRCVVCDYVTTDMLTLMDHIDSHFPVRTYVCVHCTESFTGPQEYQDHNKPRKCPYRPW